MTIKLFTLVIALISSSLAFSTEIAGHRFAIYGAQRGMYHNFDISISDKQVMAVKMITSKSGNPYFIGGSSLVDTVKMEKDLNNRVYALLKQSIVRLSKVKISKIHRTIVCRMMAGPTLSNDHLSVKRQYQRSTDSFLGEMKLVSNPSGCWQTVSIFPTQPQNLLIAEQLKSTLEILTLDLMAKNL
jgi:disulfide bond formation protein DsbB